MSNTPPTWADDEVMRRILTECHTIAVVGLSPSPWRDSHAVGAYLQQAGYHIVPVNPCEGEILGEPVYATLAEIPFPIDLVNLFRRSEFAWVHAQEAIRVGAKALWTQLDIMDEDAAHLAFDAGLDVVMDRCLKVEHQRLLGG